MIYISDPVISVHPYGMSQINIAVSDLLKVDFFLDISEIGREYMLAMSFNYWGDCFKPYLLLYFYFAFIIGKKVN